MAMVMIVKASSNQEVDKMLRGLPALGALKWKVKDLESFAVRAAQERDLLGSSKK